MRRYRVAALSLALLFGLAGCGSDGGGLPGDLIRAVFILTTDYQTGGISVVSPDSYQVVYQQEGAISSDATNAVEKDGYVYVFNRYGADNVQVLETANFTTVAQVSTGLASNPYDGVFTPSGLLVSRYDADSLLLMKPLPDENVSSPLQNTSPAVDLSGLADADGLPEAAYMIEDGGLIYLALQRLDRRGFPWKVSNIGSFIAVINTSDLNVVASISLYPGNPVSDFVRWGNDRFLIACAGSYGLKDGGLVAVFPHSLTSAPIIGEDTLGGDVSDVAVSSDGRVFALVSSPECGLWQSGCRMKVVEVSYADGTTNAIYSVDGFSLRDIEVMEDELWIGEGSTGFSGIVVYDINDFSSELTRIATSLPPSKILPLKGQ